MCPIVAYQCEILQSFVEISLSRACLSAVSFRIIRKEAKKIVLFATF